MRKATIALLLICTAAFAQQKGTFTDPRDKKTYKTVKIGEQTWMAQNLNYHGEDGFLGLCYGDDPRNKIKKPENCQKYGRSYDYNEAMKACPEGWNLPGNNEWGTLMFFVGGAKVAGKKLKAKSGWKEYDFSGKSPKAPKCKYKKEEVDNRGRVTVTEHDKCSTDEYGFSALPSGSHPADVGKSGSWWSSSEKTDNREFAHTLQTSYDDESAGLKYALKSVLYSVRCFKGKIKVGNFEDGKQHGEWKIFHENGKLETVGNFIYGNPHGEWKTFHENGNLQSVGNMKDGEPHGEWKKFHENGKLETVGNIKDGKQHGEWKTFDENENLIKVENFKDGVLQ